MQGNDYRQLETALHDLGTDSHPSEIHGMLVGHLCAAARPSKGQRQALYESWLGAGLPDELVKLLDGAWTKAEAALDEFADFDFRLLIPDDDEAISVRMRALAHWCSGFISGLGEASGSASNNMNSNINKEVTEALQDMSNIAAFSDEVPSGEENESDFMEIEEFVRVSTLLIYAEMDDASKRRPSSPPTSSPPTKQ